MNKSKSAIAAAIVLASCAVGQKPQESANYAIEAKGAKSEKVAFFLEVADNNDARLMGFQHRKSVPEGTGMLFVFDAPDYHAMWMKNTLVPLDMVFLNDDKVVTFLAVDRVPLTEDYITPCNVEYELRVKKQGADGFDAGAFFEECEDRFMKPEVLTRYVIELPAGSVAKYGIRPGDVLVSR
jgi:uncharacterized membrane protein (UPF0127 family)